MKARQWTGWILAWAALGVLGWWTLAPSSTPGVERAVLLTAGWRDVPANGISVYRLPEALPHAVAQLVPDIATLRRMLPALRELEIRGIGLESVAAAALRDVQVTWPDRGAAEFGPEVAAIDFTRELKVGQPLRVTGRAVGLSPGAKVPVTLEEPDGQLRRTEMVAGADGTALFAISGQPTAAAGRFLWRLRLGEKSAGETLGVAVVAPHRPRVLITQQAPSWELARLYEWLNRDGSAAVLRTRVSADRWRLAGVSGPKPESAALNAPFLSQYDLVVATEESLRALEGEERAALETAVREQGLGLLVVGEPKASNEPISLLPWKITLLGQDADSMVRSTRVRLVAGREWPEPITVWAAAWPERPLSRALVRDPQGNLVVALEPLGRGWLGRSMVVDAWRWPLAGHAAEYAALWSELIGSVARSAAVDGAWRLQRAQDVIQVGQPVTVTWTGEPGREPRVARLRAEGVVAAASLSLAPLANQAGQAWTRWWPVQRGWHRLETETGVGFDLYVSELGEWSGVERARRHESTTALVQATVDSRAVPAGASQGDAWLKWRWAAWAVFVAAAGALWWRERKAL